MPRLEIEQTIVFRFTAAIETLLGVREQKRNAIC